MNGLPSVDDISRDLPGILGRIREGSTRAFSFGDEVPEAVVLTYDEFEDLGGEAKFDLGPSVLEPAQVASELPRQLTAVRAGRSRLTQLRAHKGPEE